jgi:hypothetical protein
MNAAERYLSFGGSYVEQFGMVAIERESKPTWVETTIKILSMVLSLGLLPLLVLVLKVVSRCCNDRVIVFLSRERNPALYERVDQAITMFDLLSRLADQVFSRAMAIHSEAEIIPPVDELLVENLRANPIIREVVSNMDPEESEIFTRLGREFHDKQWQYERECPTFGSLFDSYLAPTPEEEPEPAPGNENELVLVMH